MFDWKKVGAFPSLPLLFLLLLAGSLVCAAQQKPGKDTKKEDKEKQEQEAKLAAAGYIKLAGKVRCEKPETAPAIEVPDRPGHALQLEKRKCQWIEPMKVKGAKTAEGTEVGFAERMEGSLHTHGFEVDKLDSGEELTMHVNGQMHGDKAPAKGGGRWNFMRGTGKFKGIKGGGTYEATLDAEDVLTVEFEGVYDPSEMVGGKQ